MTKSLVDIAADFVQRLLMRDQEEDLLDGIGDDPDDPIEDDGEPPAEDLARAWFISRLSGLVAQGGERVAGHVQFLSLEPIRDRLGSAWPKLRKKVMRITDQVLRGELSNQDVSLIYDDISFIILFADLNGDAAKLRCAALAQRIAETLLGEDSAAAEFTVQAMTLSHEDLSDWLETAKANAGNPPMPQKARSAAREMFHPTPSTAASPSTAHVIAPEEFEFVPFLNLTNGIISGYRLRLPVGHEFPDLKDEKRVLIADLDRIEAAHACHRDFEANDEEALLMVPLHFSSLRISRRRALLRHAIEAASASLRRHLIIEVRGQPEGFPSQRIAEIVSSLYDLTRAIVLTLPSYDEIRSIPPASHLHAVIVDWRQSGSDLTRLAQLADHAYALGLRVMVENLEDKATLPDLRTCRIRYACGPAIASGTHDPHGLKKATAQTEPDGTASG